MNGPGAPNVLRVATHAVPELDANQVLVKVAAAGVNGPDLMQRKGLYPAPKGASELLGLEVSGTVIATGRDVDTLRIGDTVTALTNGGGYAEFCAVDAGHCLTVPSRLSLIEAAALPETYFTVWSNVFIDGALKAGETLLVHGGAGGIGSAAIQLAKAFGARVIATDIGEEKAAFCSALGADFAIDVQREDFVQIVRDLGGAHVILDIVGGPNIGSNIKAARHDGRIIQIAFAAGSKVDIDLMPVMLKRLTYRGSTLRTRPDEFKARVANDLRNDVWPLLDNGILRPEVRAIFSFAEAYKAHALMESAEHLGKIVLVPGLSAH